MKIQDRNGNYISLQYQFPSGVKLVSITDSTKHSVSIAYDQSDPTYGTHDKITIHRGGGTNDRIIRITKTPIGNALHNGSAPIFYNTIFPLLDGLGEFNLPVISKVWLPNDQHYQLLYNTYGELSRVIMPAGGAIEYDWQEGVSGTLPNAYGVISTMWNREVLRRVKERRTYPNGGTGTGWEQKQEISRPESKNGSTYNSVGYVDVKTWGQGSILLSREKHYYIGVAANSFNNPGWFFGTWNEGREWKTEYLSDNGEPGTVKRTIEMDWVTRTTVTFHASGWQTSPSNEPRIAEIRTTLEDGKVSKVTHRDPITGHVWIDEYNNVQKTWQYDFGIGAPGPLIRSTRIDYLTTNPWQGNVNYATDLNIHIRNLPKYTSISGGNGVEIAKTWFDYDAYGINGLPALQDCPGISQHDGGFHTGYGARGNLLKITRLATPEPTYVTQHFFYDIAGNVVQKVDGRGISIMIDYRDNFGSPDDPAVQSSENPANNAPGELGGQMSYAFPFKITNALGHKAYNKYDYYLGRPVLSEDANNAKSSFYYNDALDRPTRGVRAIGTAVASQTVFVYNDSDSPINGYPARSITSISDKDVFGESNSGTGRKSVAIYDGLGRTWRSAEYEGWYWTITDTQFDALGRVSQVSNPYRSTDPGAASPPSGLWTTTEYDALGRGIKVTTPDGAHVDTAYSGNNTLVIDQAGKKRISRTDALGRLTNVWEVRSPDAASGTVSVSFPNHPEITAGYQTDYLYDPLDNLRLVTQGAQTRWFSYDSLSRLIRVRNMEQNCNISLPQHLDPFTNGSCWSMAHSYDANGNLIEKIDARNIKTAYGYDALNRNTTVDYNNTAINPDITRVYDNTTPGTKGKGRFWHDYAGGNFSAGQEVEHNSIDSYDALGRPLTKRQHFKKNGVWSGAYSVSHTYDLAGNVKRLTYPSGRFVDYTYDQAGRLSSFGGNLGGGASVIYADTVSYNAAGQIIKERFVTNTWLYHNLHYNNRMQLVSNRFGDSETDVWNSSRGAIDFFYGSTAVASGDKFANDTDNNGNLRRQTNYVPLAGGGNVIPQRNDYTYDELNRISSFTEAQRDSGGQWTLNVASQNFSYDRFGNRKITSASGGVNNYNPTYDTASNRINGLGYDATGNITNDPLSGGTMTYDAENRLLTATSGGGGNYIYNADGNRVRRITAGQETWQIYGCGGELLAEYAANASPSAPQKEYGYRNGQLLVVWDGSETGDRQLQWLVQDHLGSTRMVVDRSGSLGGIRRHDFAPFGEELFAGVGIRSASNGYSADFVRQKFGSKVRDDETGLDYFGARYFASL